METALAVSQAKYWHLRRLRLFSGLPEWQLRQLVSIAHLSFFKAGEAIQLAGAPATAIHVIRNGKIKLTRSAGGKELILDYLGPGEIFSDSALSTAEVYAEGAVAAEDSFLCIVGRQDFLGFLAENRGVALQIMGVLARRKTRADRRAIDLLSLDVRTRLARTLVDLADRFGTDEGQGRRVDLRLTQSDLGQLVGSTRETTSMAFNDFRRRGWVDSEDRRVRVLDREALAAI
jgi:CRP/FNR family transcriptional regulator